MKTLCCGPCFRRESKSIHRWQSSGRNPVCTASPRNQRYSGSATLEKKQSLYPPVVTEAAAHMRSQENACESYFYPSIVEKRQFNFGLESSELRLHLGRIPNRVLGEQRSFRSSAELHRRIAEPQGQSTATPPGRLPSLARRLRVHSRASRGRHRTNGPSPRSHLPRQARIPSEVRRYLPFWPG